MNETLHTLGEEKSVNPALKLALEFGPLIAFFVANARGEWIAAQFPGLANWGRLGEPIFIATAVFMVATAISLSLSWILTRSIPMMPLVSGVFVFISGGLTLWLQDELFIKLKPTVINTFFGLTLLVALFAFRTSLLRYVFDTAFAIDEEGWRKLTIRWGLFFLFLAVLNEIVWRNFSTDFWVAFKVWGTMPVTIGFVLSQMPMIMRHQIPEAGQKDS